MPSLSVLVFSRFCRVKKIVMAARGLTEKAGGGETTFPEQEELRNGNL